MIKTFFATLNPMLTLFCCIVIGYVLYKSKILNESAGRVMAKLETWVFCPALNFYTMAYYCTLENISVHLTSLLLSSFAIIISLIIAFSLSGCFAKKNTYERNVYKYALAFANSGYLGDPVVLAMLGEQGLAYYKFACLPILLAIYTWGINILVPKQNRTSNNPIKNLLNAPMVALFLGIIVGISGIGEFLLGSVLVPTFFGSTLNSLKACMGPIAMLLAGFTIARYPLKPMLTNVKVYIVSILRLFILPALIVGATFCLKTFINYACGTTIGNYPLYLIFFSVASALGLNTVVFPEAYGGDPKIGASMAMVSHTLSVISVPIMYALLRLTLPL